MRIKYFIITTLCVLIFSRCKKDDANDFSRYYGSYQVTEVTHKTHWVNGSPIRSDIHSIFTGSIIAGDSSYYLRFIQSSRPVPYPDWYDEITDTCSLRQSSTDSLIHPLGYLISGKIKSTNTINIYYFYGAPWSNSNYNITQVWVKIP